MRDDFGSVVVALRRSAIAAIYHRHGYFIYVYWQGSAINFISFIHAVVQHAKEANKRINCFVCNDFLFGCNFYYLIIASDWAMCLCACVHAVKSGHVNTVHTHTRNAVLPAWTRIRPHVYVCAHVCVKVFVLHI